MDKNTDAKLNELITRRLDFIVGTEQTLQEKKQNIKDWQRFQSFPGLTEDHKTSLTPFFKYEIQTDCNESQCHSLQKILDKDKKSLAALQALRDSDNAELKQYFIDNLSGLH